MLDFDRLRRINVARCQTFHELLSWRPSQWSNAMAGECGEACNLTKKMDRLLDGVGMNKLEDRNMAGLTIKLGYEVADAVIYADLLLARVDLSLGSYVVEKFNLKSDELGSKFKL